MATTGLSLCRGLPYEVIRLYLQEARDHILIYLHDDSHVVEVAVISCCENCDEFSTGKELVTIFLNLMGTTNQVQIILLVEVFDDHLSKGVRYTSVILTPIDYIFLRIGWVGPKEIAQ